jgi:hypothetical protein
MTASTDNNAMTKVRVFLVLIIEVCDIYSPFLPTIAQQTFPLIDYPPGAPSGMLRDPTMLVILIDPTFPGFGAGSCEVRIAPSGVFGNSNPGSRAL